MPNGLLDVGLSEPRPVVAGLDGSVASVAAAYEAAHEAVLRGAALELVTVPGREVPLPRRSGRVVPGLLDDVAASIAERYPGLPVTARSVPGRPAAVLTRLSGAASLLVLGATGVSGRGWAAGSACRPVLARCDCPVLLAGANRGFGDQTEPLVVGAATGESGDADVPAVIDVALAEAVRRRADLLVLRPYVVRRGEDAAGALQRVRAGTTDALRSLGLEARHDGPAVTAVHTREPVGPALVQHAAGAQLVVVDAVAARRHADRLAHLACAVVVVPSRAATRREASLAAYRQALVDELARTPQRQDGCTTPEQLDDAWRVGMASPAVSEPVAIAWRGCLQAALAGRAGALNARARRRGGVL